MISGFFDPTMPRWPAPYVRVFLHLPNSMRTWIPVFFLIDTGATSTCLHPRDAILTVGLDVHTLLDPTMWKNHVQHGGVGGQGIMYYREPAIYRFRHDDGRIQEIIDEISIAQPRVDNQQLPSLLGRNVLEHFCVTVDKANNRITLS